MFDALSDRLQAALGDLGRARRLDEDAVNKAMREIRLALLEADVNFQVVKDFVASVKADALGEDILKGLDPGQQVVKLVHDKLTELMGTGDFACSRNWDRTRPRLLGELFRWYRRLDGSLTAPRARWPKGLHSPSAINFRISSDVSPA